MEKDILKKGLIRYVSQVQESIYDIGDGAPMNGGTGFKEWLNERSFTPHYGGKGNDNKYIFDGETFSEVRTGTTEYKTEPLDNILMEKESYREDVIISFQPNNKIPKSLVDKLEELGFSEKPLK